MLIFKKEISKDKYGNKYSEFECSFCHTIINRQGFRNKENKSCGCKANRYKNRELPKNSSFTLMEPIINQKTKVLVKCNCGNILKIFPTKLLNGKQIGCIKCNGKYIKNPEFKNGLRNHDAYGILSSMKDRCYNIKNDAYQHYGGIGIKICNLWKNNYKEFCLWADKTRYKKGLTIDRIDVNKDYSPQNCRWISFSEQRENKHIQRNNTTGATGVSFNKILNKYESYYGYNNKKYRCGYYNTIAEAKNAREKKLLENNIHYNRQQRNKIET